MANLASVIIVLIHLIYATAWAAPTRLDNKLLPRGAHQSSEPKPPGPVQEAIETITAKDFIGSGFSGRVFRLKEGYKDEKAVVKVMKVHVNPNESNFILKEADNLRSVQQLEALGITNGHAAESGYEWRLYFFMMKDMGLSAQEMVNKGVHPDVLKDAAAKAIKWYRKTYAMENNDAEGFKNFAFQQRADGIITAHIVDWTNGKKVAGIKPEIEVDLNQPFTREYWHSQHVNKLFLENLEPGHV